MSPMRMFTQPYPQPHPDNSLQRNLAVWRLNGPEPLYEGISVGRWINEWRSIISG